MSTINTTYIDYLRKIAIKNATMHQTAMRLIQEIAQATTIEQLITVFTEGVPDENDRDFCTLINSWKESLKKTVENHREAKDILNSLEMTQDNTKLITLLKDLINEPRLLLHNTMPSLLNILCKQALPLIIEYIVGLKQVEVPSQKTSPKGSFFARENPTLDEQACIALLANLSAAINDKNAQWDNANGLLQTALIIYSEFKVIQNNLNNEPAQEEHNRQWCVLF
jgi:23S rRNA maturation mini-RNase III